MDSISQAALGAAVGEAVLGRRAGKQAAAWGAFFGTLPDLDVLVDPFVSDVHALLAHRGPTHALLFSFVIAPPVGWLLNKGLKGGRIGTRGWTNLVFWALLTHPLLDAFTGYGTQLLWPFSRYPVAFSTISIVDPLYTIPLLLGLLVAYLVRRNPEWRVRANGAGLALSTLYLGVTVLHFLSVERVFTQALERSGIDARSTFITPTLFNNLLWSGLADDGERVWVGLYSRFDDETNIRFEPIDKGPFRLEDLNDGEAREVLAWFTRGFYRTRLEGGRRYVDDLHVGRLDLWLDGPESGTDTIFRFGLVEDPATGAVTGFETLNPVFSERSAGEVFRRLWRRMLGQTVVDGS